MKREELIDALSRYFGVRELVCDHTYKKWGERSWQFLDTDLLNVLLVIRRDILKAGMTINNSSMHQRGLRCNMCNLVSTKTQAYLSAHVFGKAIDATIVGMTAEEARKLIIINQDLLPCRIRMEADVTWLHIDVMPTFGTDEKITIFHD